MCVEFQVFQNIFFSQNRKLGKSRSNAFARGLPNFSILGKKLFWKTWNSTHIHWGTKWLEEGSKVFSKLVWPKYKVRIWHMKKIPYFPNFWKSKIWNMRVVILNQGLRPKFWEKICIFSGSGCMNAPFFLKRLYIEGVQKNYLFFPWRPTPLTYYPPNECKYRNYSLFCEMGIYGGKARTPGESCSNCLQWTQLFPKISTGSIA